MLRILNYTYYQDCRSLARQICQPSYECHLMKRVASINGAVHLACVICQPNKNCFEYLDQDQGPDR